MQIRHYRHAEPVERVGPARQLEGATSTNETPRLEPERPDGEGDGRERDDRCDEDESQTSSCSRSAGAVLCSRSS